MKTYHALTFLLIQIVIRSAYNNNFRLLQIDNQQTTNEECNLITTCYECNSPLSKCQWEGYNCIYTGIPFYSSFWFDNLLQCQDDVSIKKSFDYCHIEHYKTNKTDTIWIKKSNDSYDFSGGLFCVFPIEAHSSKIKLGPSSSINVGMLGLKIINKKEIDKCFNEIPIEDKDLVLKDISQLILYYYANSKDVKEIPFQIEIESMELGWTITPIIIIQIILGTLLFLVVMTGLLFLYISFYKRRKQTSRNQANNRTVKGNENTTSSDNHQSLYLECVIYDAEKVKLFNEKCPFCLDKIVKRDKIIKLKCNHGFHDECLSKWMKKNIQPNVFCPLCHLKITPNIYDKIAEGLVLPTTSNS